MPNYVTHRIVLTGPADTVAHIRKTHFAPIRNHKGEESDYCWDFDSLIPMPPELKTAEELTSGIGALDQYLVECITGKPYPTRHFSISRMNSEKRKVVTPLATMRDSIARIHAPVAEAKSYSDILRIMEDAPPRQNLHWLGAPTSKDTDIARLRAKAIDACGFGDSLEWCTQMWGTKWGSFRCGFIVEGEGTLDFYFETAWSPPIPVIRALAQRYPTIQLHGFAFDEGWNYEAEIVAFRGWSAVEQREATPAVHEYVYRRPHVTDEEDAA